MAVMTSAHPDAVAVEAKTQLELSSDKMALDKEINGSFNSDDPVLGESLILSSTVEASPPDEISSSTVDVNGSANLSSFASNRSITASDPAVSESTETPSSAPLLEAFPHPSLLPETATATTTTLAVADVPLPSARGSLDVDASASLASADSAAIDTAVEDVVASSTVLPVVEAQQSDLRDSAPALDLTTAVVEPLAEQQLPTPEVNTDSDLPSEEVEKPIESITVSEAVDEEIVAPVALPSPLPPSATQTPPRDASDINSQPLSQSQTSTTENIALDIDMLDAPEAPASAKIAREREEDEELNEPSAKRTKTEDGPLDGPPFDTPGSAAPAPAVPNGEPAAPAKSEDSPLSAYEIKEFIKIVKNVARTQDGKHFRLPVGQLWPQLAEPYAAKVSNPVDFSIIEKKLRDRIYPSLADLKTDVNLVYENAMAFNGTDHTVTSSAARARDSILAKLALVPPEPTPALKKEKKAKILTPSREPQARSAAPRRQSRGAGTVEGPAPPTFALDPQTSTPLIRRDSTVGDGGRPKREIHPPKNKDLPYMTRPKSKKFATELKFCETVLSELRKQKHLAYASPFLNPVDPVALSIPQYFNIIKHPMDLSTVSGKLSHGAYSNAKEFEKEVRLIFTNCYKFNPQGNAIREMGKNFEAVFNNEWAKKDNFLASHAPAAASPTSTHDSDEDEDDEDEAPAEPEPVSAATSATAARLIEEQTKLITLMQAKDSNPKLVQMQQDIVNNIQRYVKEEADAQAATVKKTKKPKPSKAPKKAAPAKKAGGPKKGGANRQASKYMGTMEKEVISAGLGSLEDAHSQAVLEMIKNDKQDLDMGEDGSLELDIDSISIPVLWKIYDLIMKHAPEVEEAIRRSFAEREAPRAPAKPAPRKKNKPMGWHEQESKIEQLKHRVQDFEIQGSGSQERVLASVEQQYDSSGDEDSDSEEE